MGPLIRQRVEQTSPQLGVHQAQLGLHGIGIPDVVHIFAARYLAWTFPVNASPTQLPTRRMSRGRYGSLHLHRFEPSSIDAGLTGTRRTP